MEKSERTLNLDFKKNIGEIISKMLNEYNRETVGYIED